ncbi:diguanylate cyclase [Methylobacterium komagatae]|uniref:diguanylate cyclase n=1 Tax=Methylobacterium komagatae TaxID=374425 RepID=A0ABW2BLL4_9HYPH
MTSRRRLSWRGSAARNSPRSLPGASLAEARRIGEAVASRFAESSAEGVRATVSIGLAETRPGGSDLGQLLASADRALYRAKALGRNRVEAEGPAAAA